ncbi:MAG: tRNA (adenosine(37)-N6)-threonylcarbamoyltransferase complex ATPase subunit type 1 TsaE [candidate division Zixibacteria bacterium]|nr:tRNA (adenosine(37)-N6)-threonylcarbamoyltransferase complex ATPase subunit type 1 TsaE [candidate division Zixibacteria bacterium]
MFKDKIITRSPEETKKLGEKLAESFSPGEVVALFGPLGSGKTCLTQGICSGLEVKDFVVSPSFVLINEYEGKFKVYHIDLFRLERLSEIINLGYEEYFFGEGICIIEWAEKAIKLLPEKRMEIYLKILSENERKITICKF